MYVIYTYDLMLAGTHKDEADQAIQDIKIKN